MTIKEQEDKKIYDENHNNYGTIDPNTTRSNKNKIKNQNNDETKSLSNYSRTTEDLNGSKVPKLQLQREKILKPQTKIQFLEFLKSYQIPEVVQVRLDLLGIHSHVLFATICPTEKTLKRDVLDRIDIKEQFEKYWAEERTIVCWKDCIKIFNGDYSILPPDSFEMNNL